MSVKGSIWFVAKIIIITALLAIVLTAVGAYSMVFIFQSRINAVGENMQMELTKNNTLYTESYAQVGVTGGTQLAGFAKQLQRLAEQSNGTYEFLGISVLNEDGSVTELIKIENTETGDFSYSDDLVGAYGDFRTLQLSFNVSTDIMLPTGAASPLSGLAHQIFTYPVTFEYVSPCLRYIK